MAHAIAAPKEGNGRHRHSREIRESKLQAIFPVRASAQGSLCPVPFPPGWSSKGAADFRSTKIGVRNPFLDKISEKLTKIVLEKMAHTDLISIEPVIWLKNANRSKISLQIFK